VDGALRSNESTATGVATATADGRHRSIGRELSDPGAATSRGTVKSLAQLVLSLALLLMIFFVHRYQ